MNVGAFLAAGARLHYAGSTARAFIRAQRIHARRTREGRHPYFIMVGGSSRLGCVGHVSAAVELADQLANAGAEDPDLLFVPLGTCGTAAGLIVGLKLAGLRTRVAAVRVADPFPANAFILRRMAQDVADYLHRVDPRVPRVTVDPADFEVIPDYLGPGYGHPTAAGEEALEWVAPRLALETTYTAKALAACLDHCRNARGSRTFVFWNTFSSAPLPEPRSWEGLPRQLELRIRDSGFGIRGYS
jgi:D-cysteine desulfhydrase